MKKAFTLAVSVLVFAAALQAQYIPETDALSVSSRRLRDLKSSDPHRPVYHFVNPDGYGQPFDPNGAIFWNGECHLAYIYQKERNGEWEHLWGHVASTDLLHWRLYPDMITVSDEDIEKGIFSGGAFLSREGVPHVCYHGWGADSNMAAYSTDSDLRRWTKSDKNPLLVTPKEGDPMFGKYVAWDPEIWYDREGECYYQISGGNPATLFKSNDMKKWDFIGEFIQPEQRLNLDFEDVSCPDFFKIGDKYMLLFIGHYMGAQYYTGTFENDRFTVESHGRMNWPGGTFFAPEQLVDEKGRNIFWGWVIERKPAGGEWTHGWSGIMSLPRIVSLDKKGKVAVAPAEELRSLRYDRREEGDIKLAPNSETTLAAKGRSMEIELEFRGGTRDPYGIKIFASPDGREQTVIKYDPAAGELVIDFSRSAASSPVQYPDYCINWYPPADRKNVSVSEQRMPLKPGKDGALKLDVFIDRSVIEVFADGQCMTQVVYPELADSDNIILFSGGEPVEARCVNTWRMSATNVY